MGEDLARTGLVINIILSLYLLIGIGLRKSDSCESLATITANCLASHGSFRDDFHL
jgi:hypothetical protein